METRSGYFRGLLPWFGNSIMQYNLYRLKTCMT